MAETGVDKTRSTGAWPRRLALTIGLALPFLAAVVAACASAPVVDQAAAPVSTSAPTTTAAPPEDMIMKDTDFPALKDMTAVRGFFVDNRLGHLPATLAVANDPNG